jgi:putative DNA primase/helicase
MKSTEPVDPREIKHALTLITDDSYRVWLWCGAGLWDELGEDGFELFDWWSARSPKYDERDVENKWEDCKDMTEFTVATIFYYADEASPGWRILEGETEDEQGDDRGEAETTNSAVDDIAPKYSEEALAIRFTKKYPDLRYTAKWGEWSIFDGKRWKPDHTRAVFSLARAICREASREAARSNTKITPGAIASSKVRNAVVSLASDDRRIAASVDQWDTDPWLLNTPDGTVDLRTGELREYRREDYMTKMTAVAPDARCRTPLFDAFLDRVTQSDASYKSFLKRTAGYSLTGSTREEAMFFVYGTGGNGKGVYMGTVANIMGDYHRNAPIETFTDSKSERHPTDLAMLRGAPLVTATETEEGKRWAESRIKELTGGDKISARFMRQDFFEYTPQFKLTISGNHKPGLKSVDEAIRRRFNILPFTVTIPVEERDVNLKTKLKEEWPGILAWMVEGCVEWQRSGLAPPEVVTSATNSYMEEQDTVGRWVDECCVRDINAFTLTRELYASWDTWAEAMGLFRMDGKSFSQRLEAMGFTPANLPRRGGRGYRGINGPMVHSSNRPLGMS